jgi:phosphohistidine phosphatase
MTNPAGFFYNLNGVLMKTLYLLRHAHSTSAASPEEDFARSLSPQGTEDAKAVGIFMRSQDMHPDFVLSSSALRTTQTAQLVFGKKIDVPNRFDSNLYHASAETLFAEICSTDDSYRRLLVVAHNPGVANLAYTLGRVEKYAPATLCVFTAQCPSWSEFPPGAAKLVKVFTPETNKNSAGRYQF